jgi:CelD/BcsL family acetyltransferase involved in cellulose biosynthesis
VRRTESLTVRAICDLASIARLVPEWNDLWTRCLHATTFQRPEWLLSWIEIFQPSKPVFLEVRNASQLVGIVPLLVYERDSQRVLALMGGGVSDYLDVLVDHAFWADALQDVYSFISAHISGWDVLELTDLHRNSPLVQAWPDVENIGIHDACPTLKLRALDELKAVVPSHKLRNLRNARRRLERAGGGELSIANAASITTQLDAMIHLHEKRWAETQQGGMLGDGTVQRFHRRVAPLLFRKGVLRLYGLRFRERYIASLYALFEKNTAYYYLQGYDPEFREFSPGTQILGAVIEDAARLGIPTMDFLRGREPYKYAWGARDEQTFCIRQERRAKTIAGLLSQAAA